MDKINNPSSDVGHDEEPPATPRSVGGSALPARPGRRTEVRVPGYIDRIGWTAEELAAAAPPPTQQVADMLRRLFAGRPADETVAGTALLRIRDERLYRREYGDFESYCRERWGFGRDYADRMITAAAVVPTIVGNGLPAPANEGQARELARVPETERAEVWREAHERSEGRPTAAVVREIWQERAVPAPEPVAEIPGQTSIVDDDADPLPPEVDAEIQRRIESRQRRIAAEAPPLSEDQKDQLRAIFAPTWQAIRAERRRPGGPLSS